jgi:hypothetical protein
MTDDLRAKLLTTLEEIGRLSPEVRFGQLVGFLADWAHDGSQSVGNVEDAELLAAAEQHLANLARRHANV